MGFFQFWTTNSSGLVVCINLCGVLCGLIGVCAVDFALVQWRTEYYGPKLSNDLNDALDEFRGDRDGRRIERLVLELLRARRIYLDTKFLTSAWSFAITSLTFAALIFAAAIFNVISSLFIKHEAQLSLMSGFQCITMFLATAALVVAAGFELFNIQRGIVYPRTLHKNWLKIKMIAGAKWTDDVEEALYEALEPSQANKRGQPGCCF